MKLLNEEIDRLHRRIGEVEKQNRRLKNYAVFSLMAMLALVLMGAKAALSDGEFRKLSAEEIRVVDSAGKELIVIGPTETGTGVKILNNDGKRVVAMGISKDGRGSGFLVADNDGTPRIGCGMDKGLPSIAMTNNAGKKIIGIGGDEQGYGVVVMDPNEVERVGMGYKDGNTGLVIFDDNGRYARGMIREKNGVHYFSYIDENGKEIIER